MKTASSVIDSNENPDGAPPGFSSHHPLIVPVGGRVTPAAPASQSPYAAAEARGPMQSERTHTRLHDHDAGRHEGQPRRHHDFPSITHASSQWPAVPAQPTSSLDQGHIGRS